jgi:peptidoglycan hydrolase-like protein with peptidoglycan-binding domain
LLLALTLTGVMPISVVYAQGAPSASSLSESTVKALQEALNKQGITVKTDGIFTPETRDAVKKYQSQHHLPVTGEADKATLDKLGVASKASSATDTSVTIGQGAQPSAATTSPAQMPAGEGQGAMMSGPMMQGMMQGMMKTMQGMMGMMQAQAEQMPRQGQAQGGMTMNCPMMAGQSGPAMMQMMQGMMQMMQSQMQPTSKP